MEMLRRFSEYLESGTPEERLLRPQFDAELKIRLRQTAPVIWLLAAGIYAAFTLADYLYYREFFGTLLWVRAVLIVLCLAAAYFTRRLKEQVFQVSLVSLLGLVFNLMFFLIVPRDPTGPYLIAFLAALIAVPLLPWPARWGVPASLLMLAVYLVLPNLFGVVEDWPRFLFYFVTIIATSLVVLLMFVFLDRLRWSNFISKHRSEEMARENEELYLEVRQLNEFLEYRVQERTQELRLANEQLALLDRKKSEFIQIVAHELRTPMTVFTGYSQMLLGDATVRENEFLQQTVSAIHGSSKQLREIVNTMLDVVKIDSGVLETIFEPVIVAELIGEVREEFDQDLEDRNLELATAGLDALPEIEADGELLIKAFTNLVSNAIKFTPDGGQITVSGRVLPESVEIVVADNGIGIKTENLEAIFIRFFQTGEVALHSSGRTKFKGGGPGLGLTIARGIVEVHGGRIWAESAGYDEQALPGSRFHVVLPRSRG